MVDREKVIADIVNCIGSEDCRKCDYYNRTCSKVQCKTSLLHDALNLLLPKTPKKGSWLRHPHDREWSVCSICGTGCKRMEYHTDGTFTEYCYKFCPWCGAQLEEGGSPDEKD